jgi:pimeloyl-ACP methyl ester carboxylesterase
MRLLRRVLIVVLVLCVGAVVWLRARDPEDRALDDAARRGAAGHYVRLPDGVTHYDVAGPDSGARVVLVHGFSVPAYIWDSTAAALAGAGFRVARYDTYGRGWSDRPDARYDLDLFDRQLVGLLDSLGWREPVHVMGLSYGGAITATFVGRHPERTRTLTLVDPVAGQAGGVPWMMRAPLVGPLLWQGLAVPTMADGQASDFVQPTRWPDWADRYRAQTHYEGFGRALLRTRTAGRTVRYDSMYAAAGRTQKPTLLVWGAEDHTVPIANSAQVRTAIPQAEFHAIPNAGHLPQMERTDVVNPLLLAFLRAH